MLILLDMDGTVADLDGRFVERYNARFPAGPIGKRLTWAMTEDMPADRHGSVGEILAEDGFFAGLDPLPGAVEAFFAMRDAGHEVVLCTSPFVSSRWCESEKRHWVERHLGAEFAHALVLTSDKTLVRGDVLIDDRPDIRGRLEPSWRQVLLDQPWNRDADLPRVSRDWSDWKEVLGRIAA